MVEIRRSAGSAGYCNEGEDHVLSRSVALERVWQPLLNIVDNVCSSKCGNDSPLPRRKPGEVQDSEELESNVALNGVFVAIVNYSLGVKTCISELC